MITETESDDENLELLWRSISDHQKKNDENISQKTKKKNSNENLLSTNWAAIFLCSEMMGASSLSLSKALQQVSFYSGIIIYLCITLLSGTFALLLSKSYATLRANLKESVNYQHIRDPYPQLAQYVFGTKTRFMVVACIILSDFLGAAGLMLLPADMLVRSYGLKLVPSLDTTANLRIWVLMGTIVIIPFAWNDRPKDNKVVGLIAIISGVIGQVLVFVMMCLASDIIQATEPAQTVGSDVPNYILAIGVLLTTSDGFDILPNIQEDMKNPHDYKKVIIRSYILFTIVTLPIMTCGYLLFHHHHVLSENIVIELLHTSEYFTDHQMYIIYITIAYTTLVMFILHLKMSTVLQLNPTFQYMEVLMPCKPGLCLKRCIIRTSLMLSIALFVIAAPDLLPIISFNGSLLYVMLGLVFPGIIYIRVFYNLNVYLKTFIITIIISFTVYLFFNIYFNVKFLGQDIMKTF